MAQDSTEWLDIDDIYELFGRKVPKDSIREWIRTGRLRAFKPGKNYLIRREDFEKFLRESQTTPDDQQKS
jgi:excisionase family DNA binding protein